MIFQRRASGLEHIAKLCLDPRKQVQSEQIDLIDDDCDRCKSCLGKGFIEKTLSECVKCDGTGYAL